jgi:hypothetical protein
MNGGLCECGCGQATKIAPRTNRRRGQVRGQPIRFVTGHNARGRKRSPETRAKIAAANRRRTTETRAKIAAANRGRTISPETREKISGERNHSWRGGRMISGSGYLLVRAAPPSAAFLMRNSRGYVPEHRLVMAEALGRPLARTEIVHHRDEERQNNQLANLIIFQSRSAHRILHGRLDRGLSESEALEGLDHILGADLERESEAA